MITTDYAGFVKDVKTGAILGITNKRMLTQIETDNINLIKRKQGRFITHEVLSEAEGIKAYTEHYNTINGIVTSKPIMRPVSNTPKKRRTKK